MAFVETRKSCPNCGGSDPVGVNEDGSAWCFSCETRIQDYYGNGETNRVVDIAPKQVNEFKKINPNTSAEFNALTDRGISLETARHFGVKSVVENGEVTKHYYPYYILNEVAGYKVRDTDKNFVWNGDSKGTGLFGEQVASNSGNKYITITEGECDCMAAYELQGSRFPVVSVKNGAGGAVRDVKHSLEFLESFERVYINFDSDKPGREAARKVAQLLSPGKAKIVKLPEGYKDANDMLRNNARAAYMQCWWDAKTYTPSGVLNASDLIDKYMVREKKESVPYPWAGLNEKLYGMRQGELITLTGGTGLGKSSITREIEHWLVKTTNDNVGIIALEESYLRTLDCLMSIELNQRLYIDSIRDKVAEEDIKIAYKNLFLKNGEDNRVWVFSHLGVNELEDIYSKIRFMIVGCECRWIIVDHLHMLVSSSTEGDERRTIDSIMHRLRSIVEETGAGMILVSHLRRIDGSRAHENGVEVNLSHLRGSQSIAQLSDCVLALERNQQADNEQEANTTNIRVLKSRYTGDVGMATNLLYNKETGRLSEIFLDEDDFDDAGDIL